MRRCLDRGLSGKALEIFTTEILSNSRINWGELERKYNYVDSTEHDIPQGIFKAVEEYL